MIRHLEAITRKDFGLSWVSLGWSWGSLGASWGLLGASWEGLGATLGVKRQHDPPKSGPGKIGTPHLAPKLGPKSSQVKKKSMILYDFI